MTDRFLEACTHEFAAQAEWLFDHAPRIPGTGMAEIPIVGGRYLLGMPVPDCLYQRVCGALCSREQFGQDEPDLAPLPLHERDIEAMKYDDDPWRAVVGYFASSLAGEYWNYALHPKACSLCQRLNGMRGHPNRDPLRPLTAAKISTEPARWDG